MLSQKSDQRRYKKCQGLYVSRYHIVHITLSLVVSTSDMKPIPANTRRLPKAVLMLGRRHRRRLNIKTAFGRHLVLIVNRCKPH